MRSSRLLILVALCLGGAAALAAMADHAPPAAEVSGPQQALASLHSGRYAQAERAAMALATRPDRPSPRSWLIVAAARQRRGQHAAAVRAYRLYLASCSSAEIRHYVLRQMELCRLALDPTAPPVGPSKRLRADELAELAQVQQDTCVESSEHFVIRARNPKLAKLLARSCEAVLRRICWLILAGQEYPHSVDVYVWADYGEFLKHAADAPEFSGGSFSVGSAGGVLTRRIDLTQRGADGRFATIMLDRVLPHEMCHLVLREHFGDASCPLFVDEGLAMLAEAEIDNERIALAGAAAAGEGRTPLTDLITRQRRDIADPSTFYAEAFSFTEFLHSRLTRGQFQSFLAELKNGCTVADALQRALYLAPDDGFLAALSAAWQEHAIAQAQYLRALRGDGAAPE